MRSGYLLVRLPESYTETKARYPGKYPGTKLRSDEFMELVVLTIKPRNAKYKRDNVHA
jgi:hypothetical protein